MNYLRWKLRGMISRVGDIPYDVWQSWVAIAGLTPSDYADLSAVIASSTARTALTANTTAGKNAMKYMVASTSVIMPAVVASADFVTALDACVYSVRIPTLTSNTSSVLGVASGFATGATSYDTAWKSYDKVTTTTPDFKPGFATPLDATYIFTYVKNYTAYKTQIYAIADGVAGSVITTGDIQTTSDGSNWTTAVSLTNGSNFVNGAMNTYVLNAVDFVAVRTRALTSPNGRGMLCHELNIYGLDLS